MKVFVYLRVSTEQQELGLDAQLTACKKYAKSYGLIISEILKDINISGGSHYENRPWMKYIVDNIKRGDILLISNRDRLGRDVRVISRIEYEIIDVKKATIVSAADEGNDKKNLFLQRITDAFSEHERIRIVERIKAAMQEKKKRGEWMGRTPIGYKMANDGLHIEKDPAEKLLIKKIKRLHRDKMSLRKIAAHLNENSILNREKSWTYSSVFRRLHE